MSFILDALRKSEEERQKQEAPDLQTIYSPPPVRSRGGRIWIWVLLGGLLLNAVILLWWIRPWDSSGNTDKEPPVLVSHESPSAQREETSKEPVPRLKRAAILPEPPAVQTNNESGQQPISTARSSTEERKIVPASSAVMTESPVAKGASTEKEAFEPNIPRVDDLPEGLRQELPGDLNISLHFYSPEASSRMARINGRNLREGQEVSPGCKLEEITPEGVILNYRNTRFRVGDY